MDRKLNDIRVCRRAPPISHLFFADDALLFFSANRSNVEEVQRILTGYEAISGQKVNYTKSEICLSRNVGMQDKCELGNFLGVNIVESHGKYLGMSFICGQRKRVAFKNLIEKFHSRAANWSNKVLSVAGKEIIIKAIFQALPTYMMSCFLFPVSVLNELQSAIVKYGWGAENNKRCAYWINRETLFKDKSRGGLSLKDLKSFNLAMLAKQGWRILKNPESLLARVMKMKYFPSCDLLSAPVSNSSSFVWKSIYSGLITLRRGSSFNASTNTFSWSPASDGTFSAKSAYALIRNSQSHSGEQGEPSSFLPTKHLWKKIWSTVLPRKINLFI